MIRFTVLVVAVLLIAVTALGVFKFGTQPTQPTAGSGIDKLLPNRNNPTLYTYNVLRSFPHDCNAFTEGLVYENGSFYEGTGLTGRSDLRRVDVESGKTLQQHNIDPQYFGEGVVVLNDRIYELTWQSGIAFLYDKKTFKELQEFHYKTEGWGLTTDGKRLIMSDGTQYIYFRDPDTFDELARIEVTDPQGPVVRINELEYIHGWIFANVWQTNNIAIIDPSTGQVVAWLQLTDLLDVKTTCQYADVLNGIAYDPDGDRLFVVGKLWPRLYQIELIPLK